MTRTVNDYDCEFHYHPDKANKVAYALSQKVITYIIMIKQLSMQLQKDMSGLEMKMVVGKLSALTIQPTIMEAIKGGQLVDPFIKKLRQEVSNNK